MSSNKYYMLLNELIQTSLELGNSTHHKKYGRQYDYYNEKIEDILNFVNEKCSDFLSAARTSHNFLYRGVLYERDLSPAPIFHGITPTNRKPIGMSTISQQILDKMFKYCGFKSLRSNSILTTSDINPASRFGDTYFIFPINGFDFTWSEEIPDLGGSHVFELSLKDYDKESNPQYYRPLNKEEAEKFLKNNGFRNDDLVAALNSKHEISIHGQYIAISCYYYNENVQSYFAKQWSKR